MAIGQDLYLACGLMEITNEAFELGMWNFVLR